MISVAEALDALLALAIPKSSEIVPLSNAAGRILATPVSALRDQPPFAASAMDGYAICETDLCPDKVLVVVGEAAAGHASRIHLEAGQALRIFTGAPLPPGADRVVIQENVVRQDDTIRLNADALSNGTHVRPAGADFRQGHQLSAPRILTPADVALLAAMNQPRVSVYERPSVAIIATGDELVQPGEIPRTDQIIASNSYGLAAMLQNEGAKARMLPIARDNRTALAEAFRLAQGVDLILTIGGASVGDHDLVGHVANELGMKREFYKIAMRPGKPLMAGRMGNAMMVGLPGNPVSAMVCGHIFILPVIRKMLGLPAEAAQRVSLPLLAPLAPNGPREHYMRATASAAGVTAFERQDSALLTVLSQANALIIRPPNDKARKEGDTIDTILLS